MIGIRVGALASLAVAAVPGARGVGGSVLLEDPAVRMSGRTPSPLGRAWFVPPVSHGCMPWLKRDTIILSPARLTCQASGLVLKREIRMCLS